MKCTFEKFKTDFMERPHVWRPVHVTFAEDEKGNDLRIVELNMICEWRFSDKKGADTQLGEILQKFVFVPFETKEQLDEIIAYLKLSAKSLFDATNDSISSLIFDVTVEPENV